jgi:phage FluMu gp28-like protein
MLVILLLNNIHIIYIMNYIYQDKETMKPGINIFATSNLSNEIGMKLKHLSVPLILYGNCNKQYAAQPRFEVLDNLEKDNDNLIEQEKFNSLLESSLLRLPTDKKTRKKVEKIIKIKAKTNANNSRNKSKKKKGSIGKNKKSKKKKKIDI